MSFSAPFRRGFSLLALVAVLPAAWGQTAVTDPHITTWLTANSARYARIWETTADKSSGNAVSTWPRSGLTNGGGGQATKAYADVQRVAYSTNYVYVTTTGLASYTMGNWLNPNGAVYTSWPTNRGAIHRIPRTPSIPATKQKTNGSGGVWVNGVFFWANGDAQSYSTTTSTVSMQGSGIWNRLAGVAEAFNFDTANGHQPNSGVYHNHINPIALRYQLGDNVTYNASAKTYSEASPTAHSPILGWANDGLPVYGPYGYSSAMSATGGIRRMTSGFQKRDGTNGTVNLVSTGRRTLPIWAASVQGRSQTLAASEYGPNTTASYQVAPGVNGTYSLGMFAEDYEYLGDLGKTQGIDFDLNRQNVRFCVTPEFPAGTYAYFVCVDATGTTQFPDVIGQEYFATAPMPAMGAQMGLVTSITESVTEYVDAGPAATIVITGTAAGGGVDLQWNSAEGATYKVESSSDASAWTTLSTSVTSEGLATSYQAPASATYFRVTLTAIASYDTNGTFGTPVGKTAQLQFGTVTTPPTVTTQPANVTVSVGGSATFTIVAGGTAPLTYQWWKNTVAISGATSASYTLSGAQTTDAGSFTCVVTNSVGTATSNAVTLTVSTTPVIAPVISGQPVNVSILAGASATFSVTATGTAPFTYQWRKDGVAIGGATSASYTISSAGTNSTGSYSCVVTNSAGFATSNAAILTVASVAVAPTVATPPASAAVLAGGVTTFTVVAGGTAPFTYQWRKDGVAIAGATAASFTIASTQATDAGSYTCVITNSAGSIMSAAAVLTVTIPQIAPTITTQPFNAAPAAGSSVTFTIAATGTATLNYEWLKNGVVVTGATSPSYTIANVQATHAGSYTCVVTNGGGSATSAAATLTVATTTTPSISTPPVSAAIASGGSATFSVMANGTGPFTYQWSKNGVALGSATAATLAVDNVQPASTGVYRAAIANAAGATNSDPVILGLATTSKLVGPGLEFPDITHANGRIYDQILLDGAAATVAPDADQVLRISFVDLTNDIVQVEMAGAGSLSIVLDNPSGPTTATNYNQGSVTYMKGHAGITIVGATENTHLTIFSVGRITALNQALFRDDVTYDGMADVAFVAISSANGKFGGLRTSNVNYYATKGITGIYAPGVEFTGPVYASDINAFDAATPMLVLGASGDVWVTGGDLAQANAQPVQVRGIAQLQMRAGSTSHGTALPAQTNKAQLEQSGVNVTTQIVLNPAP